MIICRSMHDTYLSNAFLVADEPGGTGVFIDSGAPLEPLLAAVEDHGLTVTHVLTTHEHHDHTLNDTTLEERFDIPVVATDQLLALGHLDTGGLSIDVLATPGHIPEHAALLVNGTDCFTGDALFAGTVGGTIGGGVEGYDQLRSSIMDVLMALPDDVVVHPGHQGATTVGVERASNPFIRYWLGELASLEEPVQALGVDATLVVWAHDYDGGNKALIRFDADSFGILGGSQIHRATSAR